MNAAPSLPGYEDISNDGGVLLKKLRAIEGAGRVVPIDLDRVQVNYVGTCDGREFDRNPVGYPFEFEVGAGAVVAGWEVAIKALAVGESAHIVLAPRYGYGDAGSPGATKAETIPPGATIEFTVEVIARKAGARSVQNVLEGGDRLRLEELRRERAEAAEAKEREAAARADAKALAQKTLAAKAAEKGKKGKGGGKKAFVPKAKVEKAPKPKKGGGPTRKEREKQAEAAEAEAAAEAQGRLALAPGGGGGGSESVADGLDDNNDDDA